MTDFQDIRITGFDENRTHNPDETKGLYDIYLTLSTRPTTIWGNIFEQERRFPKHTMWRRARVSGSHIVLHAPLEELEEYHLHDLHVNVRNTNVKYRKYLEEQAKIEKQNQAAKDAEKKKLSDFKNRLKFDQDED